MRGGKAAVLGLALLAMAGCDSGGGGDEGQAPAVTLTGPQANVVVKSKLVTVSGMAVDEDGEVTALAYTLNGGPERDVTGAMGPEGAFSFVVTLVQGANTVTVVADDDDGLRGTASVSVTLTSGQQEDDVRPDLVVLEPVDDAEVDDATLVVEGTATDDVGVDRLTHALNGGPEVDVSGALGSGGGFSFEVTLTPGSNSLLVFAYDQAGNRAAEAVDIFFVDPSVDDASPDVLLTEPAQTTTLDEAVAVAGTVEDQSPIAALTWRLDDGEDQDVTESLDAAGAFSFDVPLPEGEHVLTVTAVDVADNAGSATVTLLRLPAATVSLASGASYQVMRGWRADARVVTAEGCPPAETWREALLDAAAEDVGLTSLRLLVPASAEPVNDDEDPATAAAEGFDFTAVDDAVEGLVVPLRDRLEAAGGGLRLVIAYEDPGDAAFAHRADPAEYAELMAVALGHLEQIWGLAPDAVEIVAGPGVAAWTATQVGEAAVALDERLSAEGWEGAVVAPFGPPAGAVARLVAALAVEGAPAAVTGLSYARDADAADAVLEALGDAADDAGLEVVAVAPSEPVRDLRAARAGSWQRGPLGACPPSAADDAWLAVEPGEQLTVSPAEGVRLLVPWTSVARPGDTLMGSLSSGPLFRPAAFLRPDGPPAVAIDAAGEGSLQVMGLPAGDWVVSWTTADDAGGPTAHSVTQGSPLVVSIPAAGVISVTPAP